jgi:hypothetical protein
MRKIIHILENSIDKEQSTERKVRLHYLLAKFYLSTNDSHAIDHFFASEDLLRYAGKNGLMGFRNFYRYREKIENLECALEFMIFDDSDIF